MNGARRPTGAVVGHAWVSPVGKPLDVQGAKLVHRDKLLRGTRSDTTTHALPELKARMGHLREGDTLVVTRD